MKKLDWERKQLVSIRKRVNILSTHKYSYLIILWGLDGPEKEKTIE